MTITIESLPPVSDMMKCANLMPKKQFGQNFLFDLNLTGKIARSVPNIQNIDVLEIGPGPGGLTRALLIAGAKTVTAIEKDKTTEPILKEIINVSNNRLNVIYADALTLDTSTLGLNDFAICANLPYNVGTELLVVWLEKIAKKQINVSSLTLMFQREVADRIVAKPGNKQYGRLSVLVSLISDAKIIFNVPNTAFTPKPKVQSAVVQIIPNAEKINNLGDIACLSGITAKLFGQRRKMIRSIIPNIDWGIFNLTGTERAEQLTPNDFLNLSKNLMF